MRSVAPERDAWELERALVAGADEIAEFADAGTADTGTADANTTDPTVVAPAIHLYPASLWRRPFLYRRTHGGGALVL